MQRQENLTRASLRTPKAAAIAGIIFSVLLLIMFWLFRNAVPADPLEQGRWLAASRGSVTFALNLMPFAGIAFLWFIGVLRDRLGPLENQFFATVFFGSALLLLAMMFVSAAVMGALLLVSSSGEPNSIAGTGTFRFARAVSYILINVYAIKVAGVFLMTTSTLVIYTDIAPRWIAILGYILALVLILGSYYIEWCFVVLPAWVLLISGYILIDAYRAPADDSLK
jgi:hypothetical protein